MRKRSGVLGCLLVAVILGVGACLPVATVDTTPKCGATLKADVTFTHDLVCAGTALSVGVEGITVDLNGHSLEGNGSGTGILTSGHAVAIRNGRITNFGRAVWANQGSLHGPTIVKVKFDHNQIGVSLIQVAGARVRGNSFTSNGTGISCGETVGAYHAYSSNTFSKNTVGVGLFECIGTRVRNNTFSANTTGISSTRTWSVVIESNRIAGGTTGIDFEAHNQDAVITGNTITDGRVGVRIASSGVPLNPVTGNTISSNVMRNNGAAGLAIIIDATQLAANNNVVIANVFDRNGFRPAGTTNSPLGTHIINDGAYAKVLAGSAAFTFTNNIATGNAGHGIQALTGIDDGGGNTAFGNGSASQCVGVAC